MEIFGAGSEPLCSKLLDDLAVDPSGESRASWGIAVAEAIHALNELKRSEVGDRAKQKGKEAEVNRPDVEMDEVSPPAAAAAEEGGEKSGENDSSCAGDVAMGEPGSSRDALKVYMAQSSQLLS